MLQNGYNNKIAFIISALNSTLFQPSKHTHTHTHTTHTHTHTYIYIITIYNIYIYIYIYTIYKLSFFRASKKFPCIIQHNFIKYTFILIAYLLFHNVYFNLPISKMQLLSMFYNSVSVSFPNDFFFFFFNEQLFYFFFFLYIYNSFLTSLNFP